MLVCLARTPMGAWWGHAHLEYSPGAGGTERANPPILCAPAPALALPGLAWPCLAWPGLAWPGLAPARIFPSEY